MARQLTHTQRANDSMQPAWPFRPDALGRTLLLVHLLLSPLLFSTDTAEAFEFSKVALLTFTAIVLAALGLSGWIGKIVTSPNGRTWSELLKSWRGLYREPIACGLMLLLISALVSTVCSISPRTSWHGAPISEGGLKTVMAYTVLFLATRGLCRHSEDGRRLLAASVIGAAVAATYAILQFARLDPIEWNNVSDLERYVRPFSTMGHPNFLAAFLVMVLPVSLYFTAQAAYHGQRLALATFVLVSVVSCLAIVLAMSRGAWLAGAVALAAFGIGWYRLGGAVGGGRRMALVLAVVGVLALAGPAIACYSTQGGQELIAGLVKRLQGMYASNSRLEIWKGALGLFLEHPLAGCGLDTFQLAFASKRPVGYWMEEWNTRPLRAHNEALQVLATQGVLGATALVWLTAGLIHTGFRAWRRALPETRLLLAALSAGLIGFYVQNVFSFTVAGCGTLFITLAALLSRLGGADNQPISNASPANLKGFALVLILAGVLAGLAFFHNLAQSATWTAPAFVSGYLAILVVFGLVTLAVLQVEARERESGSARETARSRAPAFPRRVPCPRLCVGMVESSASVGMATQSRGHGTPGAPALPLAGRMLQLAVWAGTAAFAFFWVIVPVRASMACRQGDRLLSQDQRQALACYQKAAGFAPGRDSGWEKLAVSAQAAAKIARTADERRAMLLLARQALERACDLVPSDPRYHAGLGRTLTELAREQLAPSAQALAEYERALAAEKNNPYFYADAANAALSLKRLDEAKRFAQTGCRLYPGAGVLRAQLGYIAIMEKRYPDAARLLGEAINSEWYREENARRFAVAMLDSVLQQLRSAEPRKAGQ